MADTPTDSNAANPGNPTAPLQFDRAEVPVRRSCSVCKKNITGSYYKIDSKIACEACQQQIQQNLTGGSAAERFVKASIFGSLAAAFGAGIYYAILAATGYELALISILVGIIVGVAVRKGSNQRGGWVYQCLAMFLTYTAIVSAYVPIVIGNFRKEQKAETEHVVSAIPASQPQPASAADPKVDPQADSSNDGPPHKPLSGVGLLIGLVFLIMFAYALPILAGFQNLVGLFIIGIGLYQAWKLNKRVNIEIKGPFPIKPPEAVPAGG
jgi:hypothetical protein